MVRCILARAGYVESSKNGWMPFLYTGEDAPTTRLRALRSLALECLNNYRDDCDTRAVRNTQDRKRCCAKQDPEARFCSFCGLKLEEEFDFYEFADWLYRLHGISADSMGPAFQDGNWWPWPSFKEIAALPAGEIMIIEERFEHFIIKAIDRNALEIADREGLKDYLDDQHPLDLTAELRKSGAR